MIISWAQVYSLSRSCVTSQHSRLSPNRALNVAAKKLRFRIGYIYKLSWETMGNRKIYFLLVIMASGISGIQYRYCSCLRAHDDDDGVAHHGGHTSALAYECLDYRVLL